MHGGAETWRPIRRQADPSIDIARLRADVYRLSVLLFAEPSVIEVDALRILSADHHENEVNRLLIWIAIATRQLLDIDASTGRERCGRICRDFPDGEWKELEFRSACNTIIHAVEINSYDVDAVDEKAPRACYDGKITIRGRGRGKSRNTRAVVEFEKFAECCIRVSGNFLRG